MPPSHSQSIKQLSLVSVAGCGPFKANLAGPSTAHPKLIASCYRIASTPAVCLLWSHFVPREMLIVNLPFPSVSLCNFKSSHCLFSRCCHRKRKPSTYVTFLCLLGGLLAKRLLAWTLQKAAPPTVAAQ